MTMSVYVAEATIRSTFSRFFDIIRPVSCPDYSLHRRSIWKWLHV